MLLPIESLSSRLHRDKAEIRSVSSLTLPVTHLLLSCVCFHGQTLALTNNVRISYTGLCITESIQKLCKRAVFLF